MFHARKVYSTLWARRGRPGSTHALTSGLTDLVRSTSTTCHGTSVGVQGDDCRSEERRVAALLFFYGNSPTGVLLLFQSPFPLVHVLLQGQNR